MKLLPVVSLIFMTQFDLKRATVRLIDGATGTGKPNKLIIKVGDGNLTFDETVVREYTLDRGVLDEVRNGPETPMDVSMDFVWTELKSNTTTRITPVDALKRRVGAAAWVSSDQANLCRPFALDVEVWYDPACTTELIEQITLPDFRYEKLNYDLKAGMIKCSGRCNATEASITRVAQT